MRLIVVTEKGKTDDDYILLAFREKALLFFCEESLLKAGVLRKQIIYISEWDGIRVDEMKVVETYLYNACHYDRILIGMSHLKDGIRINQMRGNNHKIGIPSIDIYYISKIVQLIVNKHRLDGCRRVVFELPYYIFNWDLSRSKKMAERFHIAYYFGEYHHLGESDGGQMWLRHMLLLNSIMKRQMIQNGDLEKAHFSLMTDRQIRQNKMNKGENVFKCLSTGIKSVPIQRKLCKKEYKVWSKMYLDTIAENRTEWNQMIRFLTKAYPDIEISVVVFPHNPYFIKCHTDEIRKMRSVFYKYVKCNEKIKVYDLFNYHLPCWCFKDECHLNELGAYIFTNVLNKKF